MLLCTATLSQDALAQKGEDPFAEPPAAKAEERPKPGLDKAQADKADEPKADNDKNAPKEAAQKKDGEPPAEMPAEPKPGPAAPQAPAQAPPKARPLPAQIQMRGVAAPAVRRGANGRGGEGGEDEPVFFPADRTTLQRLSKAQELLEQQRFGESVRLLGDILEGPEDYFFQPKRDEASSSELEIGSAAPDRRTAARGLEFV